MRGDGGSPRKKKLALLVFSPFVRLSYLMPSVTHIIIFVSCVFPLTSWEKRETARNLEWYLCAHHLQHYDLVLQQMKHNQNSSSLQRSHSSMQSVGNCVTSMSTLTFYLDNRRELERQKKITTETNFIGRNT